MKSENSSTMSYRRVGSILPRTSLWCPKGRERVNRSSFPEASWAGLHDNVPDRPSAKVAPFGCQLATMALQLKTVTVQKGGFHSTSRHPIWDVTASGLSCTRLADFLPSWQQIGWVIVVQPCPVWQVTTLPSSGKYSLQPAYGEATSMWVWTSRGCGLFGAGSSISITPAQRTKIITITITVVTPSSLQIY